MSELNFKNYTPFIIETDFCVNPSFFSLYLENSESLWQNSNQIYSDYIKVITGGKETKLFYVKPVTTYDFQLKRFIMRIFKELNIRPRDFRCDFFKVLPGGEIPVHIDKKSKISICIPLRRNTGYVYFKLKETFFKKCYQKMIILNNLIPHGVSPPHEERLLFRIGVHDITFEEISQRVKN